MGDDPFTLNQDYRTITITTDLSSKYMSGTLKFTFSGQSFSFPANALEWDAKACQTSFESLQNIASASCSQANIDIVGLTAIWTIQLRTFPTLPYQNNVFYHEGNPDLNMFSCDTTSVAVAVDPTCVVADVTTADLPGK
jgi:hypothetical protein